MNKEVLGPNYERPFEEPDIMFKSKVMEGDTIISIWITEVIDYNNADMLYSYNNKYFKKDKAAHLKLSNGKLSFKFTPQGSSHTPRESSHTSFGDDEEVRAILQELKAYIDKEFEKEVLL